MSKFEKGNMDPEKYRFSPRYVEEVSIYSDNKYGAHFEIIATDYSQYWAKLNE